MNRQILLLILLACALSVLLVDKPLALALAPWQNGAAWRAAKSFSLIGLAAPWYIGALAVALGCTFLPLKNAALWRRRALLFIAALALGGLAVTLIKYGVGRWRPNYLLHLPPRYGLDPFTFHPGSASFPSGHAQVIATVALLLCRWLYRLRALWVLLALTVMLTRIILLKHFPSDILIGAMIGTGAPLLLIALVKRRKPTWGTGL